MKLFLFSSLFFALLFLATFVHIHQPIKIVCFSGKYQWHCYNMVGPMTNLFNLFVFKSSCDLLKVKVGLDKVVVFLSRL